MTTANPPQLTELERQAFLAEWAYIKQRARFLAMLLGFENPFPVRRDTRNEKQSNNNVYHERTP